MDEHPNRHAGASAKQEKDLMMIPVCTHEASDEHAQAYLNLRTESFHAPSCFLAPGVHECQCVCVMLEDSDGIALLCLSHAELGRRQLKSVHPRRKRNPSVARCQLPDHGPQYAAR